MEGCLVHLDDCSLRDVESLYGIGVQLSLFDALKRCKKQDDVIGRYVELGTTVPFKAVQLRVVAVAVTDLNRHSAVRIVAEFLGYRQGFQSGIAGLVDDGIVRLFGRVVQFFKKVRYIIAGKDLAVLFKTATVDRFDTHAFLLLYSACADDSLMRQVQEVPATSSQWTL